ncbi:ferrous iron transport protein B [bacterium]|nr:ferrous iron transport protein B [bacterium]
MPHLNSKAQHTNPLFNKEKHPKLVLVGQPNCGKSTLFNEVAGYRSMASNFGGATVEFTESHVKIDGQTYDLIDLPGTYSLTSMDEAEREALRYLITKDIDVMINVVDASLLSRSLELTLQLMELEIPMVLCLNMMDEAERKGIKIDHEALSSRLGIAVVPAVASKGKGISDLFRQSYNVAHNRILANHIIGDQDVESVIAGLEKKLSKQPLPQRISPHLLATKLLESDPYFSEILGNELKAVESVVVRAQKKLVKDHGKSADEVIASQRHALSMNIFEEVAKVRKPDLHWRDRVDDILMHNVWGYAFLILILAVFFNGIFKLGGWIEAPLTGFFENVTNYVLTWTWLPDLGRHIVIGIVQGIGGGIAIVIPFLFPFLMGLALLEDVGYLPRVAFLMDGFMHKIGLHGKAVIPAMLGYGCNVPAVMATRILESRRDRFIAALISSLVPCSARMTIIFGLVGIYMGGTAAMLIYLANFIVLGVLASILSRVMPEVSPGMLFEMPAYQRPTLNKALHKTWFRLKDFFTIAWPLLILGSIILALIEYLGMEELINGLVLPITSILGLPRIVGLTLIFGVLRKELSMLMLFQALGTQQVSDVLSMTQILTFTVFVVFYIPCVATIGALAKQIKWRSTTLIVILSLVIAIIMGLLARVLGAIIW